jgi:hypothetical protein
MPRSYQPITPASDVQTTRTHLHEVLPLTGTIVSATYGTFPDEGNIKNYTHGMFQSVYDYPFLSSSANHIFDLSVGYASGSTDAAAANTQNSKKINMYNIHAQTLLGFTGSLTGSNTQLRKFESDLKLDQSGTMNSCIFIDFSRLLVKDEIKKNTFSLTLMTGAWTDAGRSDMGLTLTDANARVDGTGINSTNGGDYAILVDTTNDITGGVVFYQAGIAVITSSVFSHSGALIPDYHSTSAGTASIRQCLQSASISGACDSLRHRIMNISFNNTTQINSTIYTCRAGYNSFNYSSNPTYLSGAKIRVKNIASDNPISYVTTVGLYNSQNELLAVAKLSEPLKKSVENELTIRVRLDY